MLTGLMLAASAMSWSSCVPRPWSRFMMNSIAAIDWSMLFIRKSIWAIWKSESSVNRWSRPKIFALIYSAATASSFICRCCGSLLPISVIRKSAVAWFWCSWAKISWFSSRRRFFSRSCCFTLMIVWTKIPRASSRFYMSRDVSFTSAASIPVFRFASMYTFAFSAVRELCGRCSCLTSTSAETNFSPVFLYYS